MRCNSLVNLFSVIFLFSVCGNDGTGTGLLIQSVSAQPFSCHKKCTKFGNCNQETGECECPFGRTGKACEKDKLSACRLTPTSSAYCDEATLQSCQCLSQCYKYLCGPLIDCDTLIDLNPDRVCYTREKNTTTTYKEADEADEKDFAATVGVPYENETGVSYYRNYPPFSQRKIKYEEAVVNGEFRSLPLEECPERCNNRGACWRRVGDGQVTIKVQGDVVVDPPQCQCFYGFWGDACEEEDNVCPNKCSGRGTCKDSFCHCDPPYWGVGCQRGQAFPTQSESMSNPTDFKIYMYDLPSHIAYQHVYYAGWQGHDPNYIAYQFFLNALIKSNVRTEDPSEAHLFFIPALTYAYTSNLGHPDMHVTRVINYIREKFPYWDRLDGRDHMLWVPGDRSSCLLESPDAKSLIKLTHFGYFDHTAGGQYDMVLSVRNGDWGCYHPLRDVVMPPFLYEGGLAAQETFIERINSVENPLPERTELFFFAGGFRPEDLEYSGGTRHIIAEYIPKWNDSDFRVVEGYIEDYEETLRTTKFCLAPYGHGYGMRLISIAACGCIPVIIQEHVYQPYEEILPYEEFSIRLNNEDLPRLPSILRSVQPEQLAALQAGVAKYWPALIWEEEFGGRAFDYALLALRRRYMHLKSKYYGRHRGDLFRKI